MKNLKEIEKIEQLLKVEKETSIWFYTFFNILTSISIGLGIVLIGLIIILIIIIIGIDTPIISEIKEVLNLNTVTFTLISIFNPILWLFPLLMWKDIKKIKKQNKKYEKSSSNVKNMIKENTEILNDLNKYIEKLSNHEITIHYKFEFTEELVDKDYCEQEKFLKRKYEASKEFSKYLRMILTRRELNKLLELK